jgi:hypothetical protein
VKAGQTVGSVLKPRPAVSAAIARLVAFRDRGLISERAFLVQQRRLTGVKALRLPAAPARKKKRHWRKALGIAVLLLVGLAHSRVEGASIAWPTLNRRRPGSDAHGERRLTG